MRMLTVQLQYIFGDKEANAHKYEARSRMLEEIGISLAEKEDLDHPIITVTDKQYIDLIERKQDMTVHSVTNVGDTLDGVTDKIGRLADRFESFATKIGNAQYNEKCEVYTPGMGLMLFNKTMLLEDACSDVLQTELDNGWRIIAACPQPNQRRPDYILGRFEPNDEPGAGRSAHRG